MNSPYPRPLVLGPPPEPARPRPRPSGHGVAIASTVVALLGTTAIVTTCLLLPDPTTRVLGWYGGWGVTAHALLVVAALITTAAIRPAGDTAVDVVRLGAARRLVIAVAIAAAIAAGSSIAAAAAVAIAYDDVPITVLLTLAVSVVLVAAAMLIPVVTVVSGRTLAMPASDGVQAAAPWAPPFVELAPDQARRAVASLRVTAAVSLTIAAAGIAAAVVRAVLEQQVLDAFFATAAHLTLVVGAVVAVSATGAITGARVDTVRLTKARRAMDMAAAVGLPVTAWAWLMLALDFSTLGFSSMSSTLLALVMAPLTLVPVAPVLCHACAHHALTARPAHPDRWAPTPAPTPMSRW